MYGTCIEPQSLNENAGILTCTNDTIFMTDDRRSALLAIDMAGNDRLLWHNADFQIASCNASEAGNVVIYSDQSKSICISRAGKLLWKCDSLYNPHGTCHRPSVIDMPLFDAAGNVYQLRTDGMVSLSSTGNVRWTFLPADLLVGYSSDLIEVGDHFYFVGMDEQDQYKRYLYKLSSDGQLVWKQHVQHAYGRLLSYLDESIIVGTVGSDTVYAIDGNGHALWNYETTIGFEEQDRYTLIPIYVFEDGQIAIELHWYSGNVNTIYRIQVDE